MAKRMLEEISRKLKKLEGQMGEDGNYAFQARGKLERGLAALKRANLGDYEKIVSALHRIHSTEVPKAEMRKFAAAVSNYGNALSEKNPLALCLLDEEIRTPKEFVKFHDEIIVPQKAGFAELKRRAKGIIPFAPRGRGGKITKKPGR